MTDPKTTSEDKAKITPRPWVMYQRITENDWTFALEAINNYESLQREVETLRDGIKRYENHTQGCYDAMNRGLRCTCHYAPLKSLLNNSAEPGEGK